MKTLRGKKNDTLCSRQPCFDRYRKCVDVFITMVVTNNSLKKVRALVYNVATMTVSIAYQSNLRPYEQSGNSSKATQDEAAEAAKKFLLQVSKTGA
jgi:hypothetical protein